MLLSNDFLINNQQIYKKQTNPINFKAIKSNGLNLDKLEISNKKDNNKNLTQEEKTYNNLKNLGFSEEQTNNFINEIKDINFVNNDEVFGAP